MVLMSEIAKKAKDLGFYHSAVVTADIPEETIKAYDQFIARGYHGTMAWLANNRAVRQDPKKLFPATKNIIVLTHPYPYGAGDDATPMAGTIARYARGVDYHQLLKNKMALLAEWLAGQGMAARAVVDSAPLFEKPMAAKAGIGWQGKHTNLLARDIGNWFFLAELLVDGVVVNDEVDNNNLSVGSCGSCHACIDACPTRAIVAPYRLDARRCISYLTIEHDGMIDKEFRHALDDMLFGCDICLAVCPFNKFAETAQKIKTDKNLDGPATIDILWVLTMTDDDFAKRFKNSPIKRLGRKRLVRNGLMVLANQARKKMPLVIKNQATKIVIELLDDSDAVVRGSAVWALQYLDVATWQKQRTEKINQEKNPMVLAEWGDVIASPPIGQPPPHIVR